MLCMQCDLIVINVLADITIGYRTVFAVCFSIGEYERHLLESGAFIFYGTERFLDYVPPHKLASLNLPSK